MSSTATRRTAIGAVLVVALVAAVVSYAHMRELALEHGEGWRSVLIPLAVDGMLVAATLAIVSQRRRRRPAGWVPWLGLSLGILASLAANVAAARPELIAQLIAAWPPVALAVSIETLVVVLRWDSSLTHTVGQTSEVGQLGGLAGPGQSDSGDAEPAGPMSHAGERPAEKLVAIPVRGKAAKGLGQTASDQAGRVVDAVTPALGADMGWPDRQGEERPVGPPSLNGTGGYVPSEAQTRGHADRLTHSSGRQPVGSAPQAPGGPNSHRMPGTHVTCESDDVVNWATGDQPDPVAELIEAGAGRRRLAKELDISEHQARQLLAEHRNGSGAADVSA